MVVRLRVCASLCDGVPRSFTNLRMSFSTGGAILGSRDVEILNSSFENHVVMNSCNGGSNVQTANVVACAGGKYCGGGAVLASVLGMSNCRFFNSSVVNVANGGSGCSADGTVSDGGIDAGGGAALSFGSITVVRSSFEFSRVSNVCNGGSNGQGDFLNDSGGGGSFCGGGALQISATPPVQTAIIENCQFVAFPFKLIPFLSRR